PTPIAPPSGSEAAPILVLRGEGEDVLDAARALLAERAGEGQVLRAPDGGAVRLGRERKGATTSAETVVAIEADAVRIVSVAPRGTVDDPVAVLVPPTGFVGESLLGVRLVTGSGGRASAVATLACLLAGDAGSAAIVLDAALPLAGSSILRAWSRLLTGDLAAVHASVAGLFEDADVGPVARLLSGAALRAEGSPLEAARDFDAALAKRPDWLPALLLAAEAYESGSVRLMDRAAARYAAAHAAAPADLGAALGHAYHLAATGADRAGARRVLDEVLAARPDAVAAWRTLAWWQSRGESEDDLRAAVATLERVAGMRPDEARAWSDVGSARWALVERGGGPAAAEAAIEAYARATTLAPDDAAAWARRGSALHQAALDRAATGDVATYRARLREARACYTQALALGVEREHAARVRFNIGLMSDLLPPEEAGAEDALPADAAYAAALDLDPAFVEAAAALVAARVAARDAAGAAAAVARLPTAMEPAERAVLEAAAAFVAGDEARARERLAGPGGVAVEAGDLRATLARALLVLGHPRAAVAVVGSDAPDAASWAVRVRAHATLREVEPLREALARLKALDAAEAERLRSEPDVRAALE
ncbi:MAG TPA: hypothetical protein VND21_11720, partial [Planctomycetota bacterium]|nr:hypothetical protein [Planctomycetota bacterium]